MKPLTETEITAALADLPGWTYADEHIHREYRFGSFKEALSFIVRIGFEAERANHHPEILGTSTARSASP